MAFRFPRSLVPLPDEGLPGYLLRLAHRLDLAPARILQLTGLAGGDARFPCRTSHELMIRLNPAAREAFCQATRLDTAEAGSLCLDSLAPRYPVTAPTAHSRSLILRADWWIFSTASRYCPDCLADDTPAAKAHGGAWRRSWRLPAVFACTRHQRLLEHLCPQCQRPAFETTGGNGRIPLLPALKASGLHPAQCRASDASGTSGVTRGIITACGARLDQAPAAGNLPGAIADLQERLCALLGPHGPETVISAASPAEPARYFTDLRLLTILIGRSWPRARHLLPFPHLADAIGRHVAMHDGRQRPSAPQQSRLAGISALARPLDPAAGAGMLLIADQILRLPALPDVREAIQPLLPPDWNAASSLTRKMHLIGSARPDCSPGLLKAVTPLARAYPRRGLKGSRAPEITCRLGPENIPAQLPEEYFDQYLLHIEGASPRLIRRTASVRLVQMLAGGPLGDAADFLGLPASPASAGGIRIYAHRGILKITNRAGSQRDPAEFDAALEKIAAHITAAGHLTDYKHRRDTLRTWALSPQDWLEMLRSTRADPGNQLCLGERERQWASVLVWAKVTLGEPYYAPRPVRDQQAPGTQQKWRNHPHPRNWPPDEEASKTAPSQFYLALSNRITSYAAELAAQIDDAASQPPSRPGPRQAN